MDQMQSAQFQGGLGGLLGGLFGDSGAPYGAAMDQYKQYEQKAQNVQNPFFNAGKSAIPQYQDWLKNMQDPSAFINHLMTQYQQSPWAKFQQQQSLNAANNMGSASGLTGSTPLQLQAQQNSSNIASGDMNQWLQNVLGINTQYGAGNQFLQGEGTNSANALTNLYGEQGKQLGEAAYGQKAGQNQDFWNTIGGAGSLATMFL